MIDAACAVSDHLSGSHKACAAQSKAQSRPRLGLRSGLRKHTQQSRLEEKPRWCVTLYRSSPPSSCRPFAQARRRLRGRRLVCSCIDRPALSRRLWGSVVAAYCRRLTPRSKVPTGCVPFAPTVCAVIWLRRRPPDKARRARPRWCVRCLRAPSARRYRPRPGAVRRWCVASVVGPGPFCARFARSWSAAFGVAFVALGARLSVVARGLSPRLFWLVRAPAPFPCCLSLGVLLRAPGRARLAVSVVRRGFVLGRWPGAGVVGAGACLFPVPCSPFCLSRASSRGGCLVFCSAFCLPRRWCRSPIPPQCRPADRRCTPAGHPASSRTPHGCSNRPLSRKDCPTSVRRAVPRPRLLPGWLRPRSTAARRCAHVTHAALSA